jgi:SAM-dependent MidA family methyltransferase
VFNETGKTVTKQLEQLIIERIKREGPITFAEYMRMALYEPDYGYYVTGPPRMGWEGDYYTSTDVSSFFANCMGRQLQQMWEKLGRPARFVVLEHGAGREHLAQGIRTWSEQEAPAFNLALDYRTLDIRLGQDAREPLSTYLSSALSEPSAILSNELVDAFPVHIVEIQSGRLYELFVDVQEGQLCEVLAEPSKAEVATYLENYNIPWHSFGDGWRAEINLNALRWVEHVAHLIRRGFILTIDYGDKAGKLYTRYRRRGTLACYMHHQMNDRPLAHPGEQDITAHVNFSALINAGRRHGLRLSRFTTQRLWLEGLGIYEELEQRRRNEFREAETERATDRGQVALLRWYNLRQRAAALTDTAGMGNFKVLILRR